MLTGCNVTACGGCRAGSNNWTVSGAHSASGKPLVSNDMHLSLRVPDIWYEAALHLSATCGGTQPLDVVGFTMPGLPWVIVGRNAHVAWSFTNLGGDVQDVRVEHTRGSGSSLEFELPDGTWSPMQHHTEHIVSTVAAMTWSLRCPSVCGTRRWCGNDGDTHHRADDSNGSTHDLTPMDDLRSGQHR